MKPLRPCMVSTCPNLVSKGSRCPTHAITREQRTPHDPKKQAFYDSPQWRKLRAIVRRQQPICMECKRSPSKTVDHINGLDDNRLESLRALCWPCHNRKSGLEHRLKALGGRSE